MEKAYSQMMEAYQKMYEGAKHIAVPPYRPVMPVVVNKTHVSVDVTEPYIGPGGVEKAYYTYPAGFDPTNREDVMKSGKGTKKEEVEVSDIELVGDYLLEAGLVETVEAVDAFYAHMSDEWKTHIIESLKQARKNVGASTCWDGYKAKGTKMKGGKSVPNCVKEDEVTEAKKGLWDNIHAKRERGGKPAKPGDKNYPKTLNVD